VDVLSVGGTGDQAEARPLRRDAERNRQRILRAAAEVFTERGLDVTLDDIAHHAGVGVGTVYRRYPSKQALAEALFVDKLAAVAAVAEQALAKPDSWEALAGFLEGATELIAADRGLRQLLMSATHSTSRIDQARARLQQAGIRLVERAQHDGAVRSDLQPSDLPLIEFMLATTADYAWHVRQGIWRRYLTVILDGLRPARPAATPLPEPALTGAEMQRAHQAVARPARAARSPLAPAHPGRQA
jgi:AcrR family transcriptional regulator